jgi:hypothetical protein
LERRRAYAQAAAVTLPLAALSIAFSFVWTIPGEAQLGLTVVSVIPVFLIGFPLNALFGLAISVLLYAIFPLADPLAPFNGLNWRDITSIASAGVGSVINTSFIIKRFGFRKTMLFTCALSVLIVIYILGSGWLPLARAG